MELEIPNIPKLFSGNPRRSQLHLVKKSQFEILSLTSLLKYTPEDVMLVKEYYDPTNQAAVGCHRNVALMGS